MVLAVPPENLGRLRELFNNEDVETTVIGQFTGDKELSLYYGEQLVGNLSMGFLHDGRPQRHLKAVWEELELVEPDFGEPADLTEYLLAILASPNVASKESIIRRYDHEVQGGTVLKPLVGVAGDGPSDATVIKPLFHSQKGVVISNGINPLYGAIDTYWMAASAIDEALRNLVAVGGDLERTVLLDNFCWGNPSLPDRLGDLVRAAKACYDMATGYKVPFISGKDSLNNEYRDTITGEQISVPPTLLISGLSVIPDVGKIVSMDLKEPGDAIYLVGETFAELGGSHYYKLRGFIGRSVPKVDPLRGKKVMKGLQKAIEAGLVRACHDLSEGGLGVAAAEMAFAGGWGMRLDLQEAPAVDGDRADALLFSESNSRFLVEVGPEDQEAFEVAMTGVRLGKLGLVSADGRFEVLGLEGEAVVSTTIGELKTAWQSFLGGGG